MRLAEFLRKLHRTPLNASGRSLFARGIAGLLLPALLLSGCGKQPVPEETARLTSADIPLLEPVAASVGTERAAYRNLYDYELLTGTVYPETEEYAFTENVTFDSFAVLPGEEVAPGTLLVNADTKQLKDQMKGVQDQIDNLTLGYEQYMELSNLQLEEYQSYIDYREEWRKVDEKVAQDVQRQIFR